MFGPTRRSLLRTLERERDQHAAERRLLIAQICHLAGRPWVSAPAVAAADEQAAIDAYERERYTARPELEPEPY